MKIAKSIQEYTLPLVSFVLASLPKASADINEDTDDAKSDVAPVVAVTSLAAIGGTAQVAMIHDLKKMESQSLGQAFKNNTLKHPLLSTLAGFSLGAAAWISPWFNFTQSTVFGLAVTALNLTASEIKLFSKARREFSPEIEVRDGATGNSVSMPEALEDNEMALNPAGDDGERLHFAKLIRNNSGVKILLLWSAGAAIEATLKYTGVGQAEGYLTDEQAAIAGPLLANSLWNLISRSRVIIPAESLVAPLLESSMRQ